MNPSKYSPALTKIALDSLRRQGNFRGMKDTFQPVDQFAPALQKIIQRASGS